MQKWWSILFGAVNLAALLFFVVAAYTPGWWLPKDVSTFGYEVDFLYYAILAITGFFFVLTEAVLVYCLWRYAAAPGRKSQYVHGNHKLEWFWTGVTAVILVFVAFAQVSAWERIKYQSMMPGMDGNPREAIDHTVVVSARQFEWRIRYADTKELENMLADKAKAATVTRLWSEHPSADDIQVVNDLHTWAGAHVRVYLMTRDVIHSLGLPNLRLMQDALPGKNIPVWFQVKPEQFNTVWDEEKKDWVDQENWPIACKELCGWGHYKMQGRLRVHKDKADYDKWLAEAKKEQYRHTP